MLRRMYAFILAAAMAASPAKNEVKMCKIDRVRSPYNGAKIPRVRCVLAKTETREDGTLTRTMDFAADDGR